MKIEKQLEIIQEAFGEVSVLFMSQEIKGTEIIMPTKDLIRIANKTVEKLKEGIVDKLIEELKKDKDEGSYYHGWQSNIAMSMYDESDGKITKEEANNGAKRFLDMLIKDNKTKEYKNGFYDYFVAVVSIVIIIVTSISIYNNLLVL